MKRLIYLSLILLVACSDTEKAEIAKETDLMLKEMEAAVAPPAKGGQRDAQFWQNAYLKLDIVLEKYKKADPEVVELTKEARTVLESTHDFVDKYQISFGNAATFLSYAVNTFTGSGTTILDATEQVKAQQKQIIERANKLQFHEEQLDIKLCAKYQIRCKANPPAAPEKK
jgi:hypothetical protein